jgi:UDP-N-acetylmuramoyl-L-alanyl-D-glutamate--2,6-diaminopimelate ligase
MRLSKLIAALTQKEVAAPNDPEIRRLVADSRCVQPGDLFVAIKGGSFDGHDFIPDAMAHGAVAIVAESPQALHIPVVVVPDSRSALAHLAAAWHDFPARKLRIIGVTGTDGKTTTTMLVRAVLEAAGHRVGMVSTVTAYIGGEEIDTGFHTTTPDALDVQGYLARMIDAGAEYAVLEATSHGLEQRRLDACEFDVAVVTNITHEHLDYHGSFEVYCDAKARLFRDLATSFRKPNTPKVAVLNADDASFDFLRRIPADRQIVYGLHLPVDVSAANVEVTPAGLRFTAITPRGRFPVESPLLGAFNVSNILAAIAVGISQDIAPEAMVAGIASVRGILGRMERIDLGQDFAAYIDFAHTPNALERALETARTLAPGRVIVVFGCAGLRDAAKRPMMGEIAGRLADLVVITAEDPRTEDVNSIIAAIAAGCKQAGRREGRDYWRIPDRGEAIAFAVNLAQPGDLVIVTGKGHERSMCYGATEYPWSDHEALRKALEVRLGRR